MDNISTDALLGNYFIQNLHRFKTQLLQPLKEEYAGIIIPEILDRAKWIIATDMVIGCKVGVDSVLSFLQGVNLEELLK